NNIKQNFFKYLKRYVNQAFTEYVNNELDSLNGDARNKKKKLLNKEINKVKNDLLNNTLLSEPKYHAWINKTRDWLLPKIYEKSYYYDIEVEPQKYLNSLIKINRFLEKTGGKTFHVLPLRNNIAPKHIDLDTKALVELMIEKGKREYLDNLMARSTDIWNLCFNMKHKIFKQKNYTFDHAISTDGYSVSIRFINNKYVENNNNQKIKQSNARKLIAEKKKELSKDEFLVWKKTNELEKKEINKVKMKLKYIEKKRKDEEFKSLPPDEQKRRINQLKKNNGQFINITDLSEDELNELKKSKLRYCDPGKRNIYMFVDEKNKFFRYSNKQRLGETKRLK